MSAVAALLHLPPPWPPPLPHWPAVKDGVRRRLESGADEGEAHDGGSLVRRRTGPDGGWSSTRRRTGLGGGASPARRKTEVAGHGRRLEFGAEEDGARQRRCESSTEEDGARPPWTPTIELLPRSISHPRLSSSRYGRG